MNWQSPKFAWEFVNFDQGTSATGEVGGIEPLPLPHLPCSTGPLLKIREFPKEVRIDTSDPLRRLKLHITCGLYLVVPWILTGQPSTYIEEAQPLAVFRPQRLAQGSVLVLLQFRVGADDLSGGVPGGVEQRLVPLQVGE